MSIRAERWELLQYSSSELKHTYGTKSPCKHEDRTSRRWRPAGTGIHTFVLIPTPRVKARTNVLRTAVSEITSDVTCSEDHCWQTYDRLSAT